MSERPRGSKAATAGGSAKFLPARQQRKSGCSVPAAPFSPPALHYIRIVSNARRGRPILRDISGKDFSWPSFFRDLTGRERQRRERGVQNPLASSQAARSRGLIIFS